MSCKHCEAFLHDYFTQPLDQENPLYYSVNHTKMTENASLLVKTILRIYRSTNRFILENAKSEMENYCCFMIKPESKYQEYEIYYQFLRKNKKLDSEINGAMSDILDANFLRIKRTDKNLKVIHSWFAFILGSVFQDVYDIHADHSEKHPVYHYDLSKGLPGIRPRPKSARQSRWSETKSIVVDDDLDDLYT